MLVINTVTLKQRKNTTLLQMPDSDMMEHSRTMEAAAPSVTRDRSSSGCRPHSTDQAGLVQPSLYQNKAVGHRLILPPTLAITIASLHPEYKTAGLLHRCSLFYKSILANSKKRRKQLLLPPVQLNVPQQSVHLALQLLVLLCHLAAGAEGGCVEISCCRKTLRSRTEAGQHKGQTLQSTFGQTTAAM